MKTIRELQQLLDSGRTNFGGTTSIETCEISDCEGNKFNADIVHGWDLGSASQCDSLLLKTVILHAENDLGMKKGFSLHSLPKAEGFYSKIGMIRVNRLDKDSLAYFEMLEKPKQQFLGEIA
ncbi:hypothetical protein [Vibrio sp. 10N.237.312.B06]|uniref:hypothetical protein n=1 Tax=Vibrio sp. 10N.237.312.B06 TaxID=3229974 RepID=UPI00354BD324